MQRIPVLVYYDGCWDDNWNFTNFNKKGAVLESDSTYNDLVTILQKILHVNQQGKMLIQFQLVEASEPMTIDDEESFQFYFEVRKETTKAATYPICVSTQKTQMQLLANQSESLPIVQRMPSESSTTLQNTQSVHTQELEVCSDITDYGRMLSKQLIQSEDSAESKKAYYDSDVITDTNHKDIEIGQIYKDKQTLKTVLTYYAIRHNFQFKIQKSCKREYALVCYGKNCNWSIRAAQKNRTNMFIIRRFHNIHTCSLEERMDNQRQATSTIIAEKIKAKYLEVDRQYNPKDIQKDMKQDYGLTIHYQKAWRAKEKALESLRGKASDSYRMIPSFMYILTVTNPGSYVEVKTLEEDDSFQYAYMAVYASIQGWKQCRPVIVVDGTFLKAAYKGTLLTATTEDAGGKIFPLAFAIVDSENDNAWKWFFEQLKESFGERPGLCIISDRHASIEKAAKTIFPQAAHGICMYHLLNNLKSTFRRSEDSIKDAFFGAARAYTKKSFQYHMRELEKVDEGIPEYLEKIGFEKWARAYCGANRYHMMTSNIAESLNSTNRKTRELPVTTLLICLHGLILERSVKNREIATNTMTRLTEKAEGILTQNYEDSKKLKVTKTQTWFIFFTAIK